MKGHIEGNFYRKCMEGERGRGIIRKTVHNIFIKWNITFLQLIIVQMMI